MTIRGLRPLTNHLLECLTIPKIAKGMVTCRSRISRGLSNFVERHAEMTETLWIPIHNGTKKQTKNIVGTRNARLQISVDALPADSWVRRRLAGGFMNSDIIHLFTRVVCLFRNDEKKGKWGILLLASLGLASSNCNSLRTRRQALPSLMSISRSSWCIAGAISLKPLASTATQVPNIRHIYANKVVFLAPITTEQDVISPARVLCQLYALPVHLSSHPFFENHISCTKCEAPLCWMIGACQKNNSSQQARAIETATELMNSPSRLCHSMDTKNDENPRA